MTSQGSFSLTDVAVLLADIGFDSANTYELLRALRIASERDADLYAAMASYISRVCEGDGEREEKWRTLSAHDQLEGFSKHVEKTLEEVPLSS